MKIWKTIKSQLINRNGTAVDGNIEEELKEIPCNYKQYISIDGCLNWYYIVKNTKRFFLFKDMCWFDKITYTIYTNITIGDRQLIFESNFNYAVEAQINLQYEIAMNELYNY